LGCPNPRSNAESFFAASLNVEHTYAELDQINLDPSVANNWAVVSQNVNNVFWADQAFSLRLPFTFPRDDEFLMQSRFLDGTESNVLNGAQARFFCKNGYFPYYNADVAQDHMNSAQFRGPQGSNYFDCSCDDGKWVCNMHCRCEGFCPDDHQL